jgi:hypothetical protein
MGGWHFGEAIEVLKSGCKVSRLGWEKGRWLNLIYPAEGDEMCFYMFDGDESIPWKPSHDDMVAEDWIEVQVATISGKRIVIRITSNGTDAPGAQNEAIADVPVSFMLSNGRVVQVTLDADKDEVTVMLHGPKCGELLITPSAGNSIRLRASGRGMMKES